MNTAAYDIRKLHKLSQRNVFVLEATIPDQEK